MSELRLDIVLESAPALDALDAFSARAAQTFAAAGASAAQAAAQTGQLAREYRNLPREVVTELRAVDLATPVIEAALARLDAIPGVREITLRANYENFTPPPAPVDASFAAGIENAPRDRLASIHRGEAVLTPPQAREWRERPAAPVTVNHIVIQSPAAPVTRDGARRVIARELRRYQRRAGLADERGAS